MASFNYSIMLLVLALAGLFLPFAAGIPVQGRTPGEDAEDNCLALPGCLHHLTSLHVVVLLTLIAKLMCAVGHTSSLVLQRLRFRLFLSLLQSVLLAPSDLVLTMIFAVVIQTRLRKSSQM
jgi:hypothetical protein